jgi:catechol 2,3-dioxygenase-like lactoylglutathione lyase family enzyme
MALHRLTSITLGVPSPEDSGSFFRDFGLTEHAPGRFDTRDAGEQVVLERDSRRRLRRLGLGAADGDDIERIARRAESWSSTLKVVRDADSDGSPTVTVIEPVTELPVVISVAPALDSSPVARPDVNATGADTSRRDVPAASVLAAEPVRVSNLTHVVYGTPDQPTTLRFFTDALGFEISDEIPGVIAFTRCGEVHHNLALQAAPITFVHHVAFEVDGVDDVVRGGSAMIEKDPDRHVWGVGRHAIGSNWFWYLREPGGTFIEYAADIDRISRQDLYRPKQWEGREFLYSFGPPLPVEFMEPRDMAELIAETL